MDISILQLFVEVMQQGSFAAVARERNIDPSSVSRAIAGLEAELGIRLFQRTTRKLSPTEAGTSYFERIAPLLEDMQQAADFAVDISGKPKGQLRITASVSFSLKYLVPLLPQFNALYPDLTIDLLVTDRVVDLVADRVDLAVRLGLLADSTLIAQRLIKTHYVVCASPKYLQDAPPLQEPTDITKHNCLRFPLSGFNSQWIFRDAHGNISEVPINGNTVISNAIALQHCAIAGMGLVLLSNWLIADDLRSGTLVNALPNYAVTATNFNTAIWLVYPSRSYVPLKVRVFIDFLKSAMN